MFLIIFSIALIIANIYFFMKKEYLYLFVPCMLFLPDYYGFDFADSLPILTVTRMMFAIFYIYAFVNKRRHINVKEISFRAFPLEIKLLCGYFALRLLSNLYYIPKLGAAAKTSSMIFFEQLMFLVCIYLLSPTREEITKLIKIIVYVACAFYIIGIFESFTFIRPFDALYTVSRSVLNDHYPRLGLLRATATMGLPGYYGNMCLITLPLILYLYETTKNRRYLFICGLNVMAVLHSGCRSDWFFYVFIIGLYFIFVTWTLNRKVLFLKNFFCVSGALLVLVAILSIVSPYYEFFYTGTVKSALNEVGFEYDLSEDVPEGSGGFGENNNYGSGSRLAQFTGIRYTMGIHPIVGLGSRAHDRAAVQYFSMGYWHPSRTYDVGYVQIFCDEGLLGFTGYLLLFLALYYTALFSSQSKLNFSLENRYKTLFIVSYMLAMLSTANMFPYIMIIAVICFVYKYTDTQKRY